MRHSILMWSYTDHSVRNVHPGIMYLLPGGFPGGTSDKEPTWQCRRCKKCRFSPWVRKIPWRRKWQPTPVFLPGNPIGREASWATVHGVTKNRSGLRTLHCHNVQLHHVKIIFKKPYWETYLVTLMLSFRNFKRLFVLISFVTIQT